MVWKKSHPSYGCFVFRQDCDQHHPSPTVDCRSNSKHQGGFVGRRFCRSSLSWQDTNQYTNRTNLPSNAQNWIPFHLNDVSIHVSPKTCHHTLPTQGIIYMPSKTNITFCDHRQGSPLCSTWPVIPRVTAGTHNYLLCCYISSRVLASSLSCNAGYHDSRSATVFQRAHECRLVFAPS